MRSPGTALLRVDKDVRGEAIMDTVGSPQRVGNCDVDEFTTLSRDVLASALGVDWPPGPTAQPVRDDNLVRSLRTHIDLVLSMYGDQLEALAERFDDGSSSPVTAEWAEGTAHRLAAAVFEDDVTNWGRVLTLVAFAKVLGRRLAARGAPRSAWAMLDGVVRYLARSKRSWILDHGGWAGCAQSPIGRDESPSLNRVLLTLAGVGAAFALFAGRHLQFF
uniref:anti-apoptotic protein NR13-like n=1 Tax=Myxine glutinosa TaxID=7769 RepID=UPI00358DFA33